MNIPERHHRPSKSCLTLVIVAVLGAMLVIGINYAVKLSDDRPRVEPGSAETG